MTPRLASTTALTYPDVAVVKDRATSMNSSGSCRGKTFNVRRFGRYDKNCAFEIAVNGPIRMTSDSTGSPVGCTTVVRYFATWPLAVISR
jgi:hypothetical protein